jgi:predicted HicB family RNase H-like nuclease
LNISYHIREEYNKQEEGGGVMPKFIPRKYEKEVISMRISVETLEELDTKANEIGISRNELINQCICFALANMEDSNGK